MSPEVRSRGRSLTWASERDRPQRRRSVLLQVLEVDRGERRRLTRRTRRSKFDEAKLQRSGQQAGAEPNSNYAKH